MSKKGDICMIYTISSYLALLLVREQIILEEDRRTYEYGFEITIANFINALIIIFILISSFFLNFLL